LKKNSFVFILPSNAGNKKTKRVAEAMKKNLERSKKFLTKVEYARYLEAMKQHAIDTRAEDV